VLKFKNKFGSLRVKGILDVGYSDNLAKFLYMKSKYLPKGPITTCNRHFTDNNIEEFKYLLHEETWYEVLASNEYNTAFNLFMNTFTYYFNTAFPLKCTYVKGTIANKLVTKGVIISRNKLRT
jgi:hypothetical protein